MPPSYDQIAEATPPKPVPAIGSEWEYNNGGRGVRCRVTIDAVSTNVPAGEVRAWPLLSFIPLTHGTGDTKL
jgi:hypothetical protein